MGLKDFFNSIFKSGEEASKKVEEITKDGLDKAGEYTEKVGREFMEKSKPIVDKFQDTSEEIGGVILEKGKEFSTKAEEFTEKIGRRILDAKDEALKSMRGEADASPSTKSSEEASGSDTYQSLFEDEPKRHQTEQESPKDTFEPKKDPFAKYEDSHLKKSHMDSLKDTPGFDSSGSFFDKAAKFADGDYGAVKDDPTIKTPSPEEAKEADKKPWTDPVAGFDDLDGDGDPVIDDAIIDDEE